MKIFWSWQSDTPGRTGRFFVRDALDDAVDKLKEQNEIDEPSEREAKDALHVDQDRQGVPGSPDLAATILNKIKETAVFVADVTPVGEALSADPDVKKKKIMNPNVAIELGYALNHPGDGALIMVMNTHYGEIEDLPFDLRHKAGPIRYCLPPDASKETKDTEFNKLKSALVNALRPYISANLVKQESLKDRVARQEKEKKAALGRESFLKSEAGVQAAKQEYAKLSEEVLKQIEDIGLNIESLKTESCLYLMYEKVGFSLGWSCRFINSLEESELTITLWDGTPPIPGRMRYDDTNRIGSQAYRFDVDWEGNQGWRTGSGYPPLLKTEQMAEEALKFLMDKIHERAVKGSSGSRIFFI